MIACLFHGVKGNASISLLIAFLDDCWFLYGLLSLIVEISLAVDEFRLCSNKTFAFFFFHNLFFYTLSNLLHSFYLTVYFLILIFTYYTSNGTLSSSPFISYIFHIVWFRFLSAADIACFLGWFSDILKFLKVLSTCKKKFTMLSAFPGILIWGIYSNALC